VWSVLGAIAAQTSTVRCTTAVTAPIVRIHPAVLAQAAATTAAMFEGRFSLGVGTGEALNEHVLGDAWPTLDVRLEMLEEAVEVMRALWTGELVRHRGRYYTVDTARLYTLPERPPPVLVSGFGPKATELAARIGDGYVNVDPSAELVSLYRERGGRGPAQGGVKVCWSPDEAAARRTVHELWAVQGVPGEAMQVLPSPVHFEQVTELVTEDMAVDAVGAVGNRVEDFVAAVQPYVEAGFDEVYLSQIGHEQDGWFDFWERELRPALADLQGRP
jgi:G6PDH family F420-dependent oxidoreductase